MDLCALLNMGKVILDAMKSSDIIAYPSIIPSPRRDITPANMHSNLD